MEIILIEIIRDADINIIDEIYKDID